MPPDLYEDYGTKNVLDVKGFEAEKKILRELLSVYRILEALLKI